MTCPGGTSWPRDGHPKQWKSEHATCSPLSWLRAAAPQAVCNFVALARRGTNYSPGRRWKIDSTSGGIGKNFGHWGDTGGQEV
eukprot:CAMPEP_0182902458 /NCGR_PEP_ID=MMETSP0034_2-20130328/30483_1 /TAXON_ID=156128 /ORGANISM="Nephroselmis pyriformis, Strain CCMP717" /LENGTH=82 /DNA_ID=CAMNT_0025037125 /DNA_START=129 /DNA_END=373 /DNA_ORIENTATION=+